MVPVTVDYDSVVFVLVLTPGSEWSPTSFHKSRPVKNPTVRKVNIPVYLVLKTES